MLGVPLNVKKQEEELKGIQSRKEEMKLPMLTDGMTVYVEKFQWLKKPPKTTQNKKHPIKMWAENLNRCFSEEDNKNFLQCLTDILLNTC